MKTRNRSLGKFLISTLLSLFLGASCLAVGSVVPASLDEAVSSEAARASGSVGRVGAALALSASWALGPWLRWLLPLAAWAWWPFSRPRKRRPGAGLWLWAAMGVVVWCGLLSHGSLDRFGVPPLAGGALGALVQGSLARLLGSLGSFLGLASLAAYVILRWIPRIPVQIPLLDRLSEGLLNLLRRSPEGMQRLTGAGIRVAEGVQGWFAPRARDAWEGLWSRFEREPDELSDVSVDAALPTARIIEEPSASAADARAGGNGSSRAGRDIDAPPEPTAQPGSDAALFDNFKPAARSSPDEFVISRDPTELLQSETVERRRRRRRREAYPLPSAELLDDVAKEDRGFSREVLQMNARLLLETLASFGIEGKINEIRPGPVITTFEFEPGPGVKVSQITSRADDLALAMRAIRIRIVAPIPGKAAVGIEVPNPYPQMVTLKEVVSALLSDEKATPLSIALGRDTEGGPISADLADMPHLLVAGATGSGKSVCLNALICSLLLRNGPDQLRLLMIDPKMLELSVYNGIPHLLHPVITDHKEALKALKIMVAEMSTRYSKLAKHGVRNILDYNTKVKEGKIKDLQGERVEDTMSYIVVIVDELADLMMLLGSELETPIARLAQMARAVGIHLVLATQRPSVNVITGVIKANFPSRIGFRVISKVDSRTILDVMGAEQLLGKGDSLFLMGGMTQPTRVHGAFLSTDECERISEYWQEYADEESRLELDAAGETGSALDLGEDDLLDDAKRIVVLAQSGSTSMIQRKLRVGYTRAARLMDMLEECGVVGPFEGSKAREVLIKPDELEAEG